MGVSTPSREVVRSLGGIPLASEAPRDRIIDAQVSVSKELSPTPARAPSLVSITRIIRCDRFGRLMCFDQLPVFFECLAEDRGIS